MVGSRPLWLFLPLVLLACGEPEPIPRAGPLTPDLYVIAADDRPAPGVFLRYARPSPQGGGLDIAVTDYTHPDASAPVSLVGVVHVADPLYFEAMQEELDRYDLVLYEGVKPADLPVAEWQKQAKEEMADISNLQRDLASWFGFLFQLDALDYGRSHFRHADMTLEEFREAGGGEFLPLPEEGEEEDGEEKEEEELPDGVQSTLAEVRRFGDSVMSKPNPLRSMARRMFAETMGTTDIGTTLEMIPGFAELILDRRNEVVIRHLEEVLPEAEGKIAIFYGAAHMADLERRLQEELGYERAAGRWMRAWALRKPLRR